MIDPGIARKTALITGANNPLGIGAAIARAFAHAGVRVLLGYLRISAASYGISAAEAEDAARTRRSGMALYHAMRERPADAIVADINRDGGWARAMEADLTNPAELGSLFDWAERAAGGVDILVNNAAAYSDADTIDSVTPDGVWRTFAMNAAGTMLVTAEFTRRHRRRGASWGRVINLSTDAAQMFPGQIAYGASKAAVEAMTRSIAHETGGLGITVNTIAPGPVQTGYIPDDLEKRLLSDIPLGRIGKPEDIADAALFFASRQADWITGQVLKVSGGHAL